jgi:Glycine rich protein
MTIRVFGLRRRATMRLSVLATGALMGALFVAASPASASAAACATAGSQVTCTFSYNGTNGTDGTLQNFVVPPGVSSVTIEAWGAQGGGFAGGNHQLGGHVKGTIAVTPGATLRVRVGGQANGFRTGGYNGGGSGGSGDPFGGGGGGASDVRLGGDTLTNRIIVAGGGGGLGGPSEFDVFQEGGAGGGVIGGPGAFCVGGSPVCPGGGPTQGGTGGRSAGCATTTNGTNGTLGVGGDGGACGDLLFGGGGGGGLYGGGGGSGASVVVVVDGHSELVHLSGGGGGGSGFVLPSATGQTNEAGIRSGNGEVTITYTPGNIIATTFKNCTTLHVGYNRFINGTIVHWTVTTNGVGTVASGQFPAIGGGTLGSKTYHFIDIALGTTLPSEASGIQSHVLFTWGNGGRFYATRDPGC